MLRKRLAGRAEPLFIDGGGLRSAASLWSGAQVWAQLLRAHPHSAPVVVWKTDRLALLQLLVAALWDGRTLQIEASSRTPVPGAWCVDGRQVSHDGQSVCALGEGGWPDLAGPERMSTMEMLACAPAHGDIVVRGCQASHGDLWLALGVPLGDPGFAQAATALSMPAPTPTVEPVPGTEVLAHFDLACLCTPQDVLNDALVPLLRCTEVWDRTAVPILPEVGGPRSLGWASPARSDAPP